jgi:hypothetical protein
MATDNIQIVGINIHEYLHYLCFIFNFQLQAGIKGDQFSIVYEPEAASVYAVNQIQNQRFMLHCDSIVFSVQTLFIRTNPNLINY